MAMVGSGPVVIERELDSVIERWTKVLTEG